MVYCFANILQKRLNTSVHFCILTMSTVRTNGFDSKNQTGHTVPVEEIKIPVPWGHISGKWWGSRSFQPVIAIHGWQDNAGTFDNLAPLLAKKIPILSIDLPGHGLSSHYPLGHFYYLFWDGIVILRRIIKHFKWEKVKLMGHSLGGAISFLYAASFPDEVHSYISIDIASPTVRSPAEMVSAVGSNVDKFLKYESLTQAQMPIYQYQEMIDLVFDAYVGSITRDSCEILMKRGMKLTESGDSYTFARDPRLKVSILGFFTMDQVMEFASRITCDVLNIRADPGMKWAEPENYDIVLDAIEKNARKVERHLVTGTHHLHLNDAESVSGIICQFLHI